MRAEAFRFSIVSTVKPAFSHGDEFCRFVYLYIAVSEQICQGHFQMIHKPDNKAGGSIVAQDQAAAFTQDTVGTVKKVLGIWIMMKAVCTDNGIKRIHPQRADFHCHLQEIPCWRDSWPEPHGSFQE